jgi:hypothetical protein
MATFSEFSIDQSIVDNTPAIVSSSTTIRLNAFQASLVQIREEYWYQADLVCQMLRSRR